MILSSWGIHGPFCRAAVPCRRATSGGKGLPPYRIEVWFLFFLLFPFASFSETTPDKTKELRQRFEDGCKLVSQNRAEPALEIFSGILREDPEARGSLLMSGIVLNQQRRFAEAVPFFQHFTRLEPDHEQGLIGMVKACQSSDRESEAEPYRLHLFQLRQSGKSAKLKVMASYEREVIPRNDGRWVSVQEYFDEADLRPKWAYLLLKDEKTIARRLQLNLLPESEAKIARTNNASFGPGKIYALSEAIYEGGEFKRSKIHRLVSGGTSYAEAKKLALEVFAQPL